MEIRFKRYIAVTCLMFWATGAVAQGSIQPLSPEDRDRLGEAYGALLEQRFGDTLVLYTEIRESGADPRTQQAAEEGIALIVANFPGSKEPLAIPVGPPPPSMTPDSGRATLAPPNTWQRSVVSVPRQVVVTGNSINVRPGPTTAPQASPIGNVKKGDILNVGNPVRSMDPDDQRPWYPIIGGGYIRSDFVDPIRPTTSR